VRPLKQQGVGRRRVGEEAVEGVLAAVRAKVAGVEEATAAGLDEEGVRVESGVVDQVGRQPKRPEGERTAILKEAARLEDGAGRSEEGRLTQDPGRRLADVDGQVTVGRSNESVMVGVTVRDEDAEKRVVAGGETRDRRQRRFSVDVGERAAEVKDEALAALLELNAAPADLARATVDASSEHVAEATAACDEWRRGSELSPVRSRRTPEGGFRPRS
jgi:hypothetical protein